MDFLDFLRVRVGNASVRAPAVTKGVVQAVLEYMDVNAIQSVDAYVITGIDSVLLGGMTDMMNVADIAITSLTSSPALV